MPRSSDRGGRNNNPTGRNQYSNGGIMEMARERPMAAAAVAAGTAAAGLFLWSRRNQISDQISNLSDQLSDWSSNMRSSSDNGELEMADGGTGASMNRGTQSRSGNSRSRSSATSGSTGSTAQSGSSGNNRQPPVG